MSANGRCNEHYLSVLSVLVVLCVLTVSAGGCTSLRKKFTRKKKEKTNEQAFVPVLDPIDYPPPSVSPEERYRYHYSLWKVWYRDLVEKIDGKESDKSQKYLVGQIIAQLEEMKKWVTEAGQKELSESIGEWNAVLAMYEHPAVTRSTMSLKRKVEASAKKIRGQLNPEAAKEFLVSGQ